MGVSALVLVAALAAVAATGAVAAIMLRIRRESDRRLTAGLHEIGTRMDALARELALTVERVREDALRARLVESFRQALDPDEVLARCVEAADSLPGVGGALATIDVDGVPLAAAAGQADVGAGAGASSRPGRASISGPPDGSPVRAVGISYHYAAGADEQAAWHSAIAVPFSSADGHVGFLTVFGRDEEPPVAGADFSTLEAIALQAGIALEAARQRSATSQRPAADPLTGLGNRHALHETLALEVARARRHARGLALCLLDLDDFKRTTSRVGQIESDGILVAIADLLRETLPPTGLAYRSGGDEFTVILPGSGRIDAEALNARLQGSLRRVALSPGPDVTMSAGMAGLLPDDDGVSLFERAERELRRSKEARKGTAA